MNGQVSWKLGGRLGNVGAGIDPRFFQIVAQFAHFGMAATAYMTIGLFSHRWQLYMIAPGVAAAAIKEYYWDQRYENASTRGSNTLDFTFYCLGIAYAAILRLF